MKYEDYVKATAKAEGSQNYPSTPRFKYVTLSNDGDSVIVRFNIAGEDDLEVRKIHRVRSAEGKLRTVKCLCEDITMSKDSCPLCAAGEAASFRAFIPLITYEQDEKGETIAVPSIWDQSPKVYGTLKSFIADYGDLRDYVFKIVRHGAKGDQGTTYTILPANPVVYKEEIFKKDFSGFEGLDLNKLVADKTAEEMQAFLTDGDFPAYEAKPKAEQPAPEPKYDDLPDPTPAAADPLAKKEEGTPNLPGTARPRRTYQY